MIEIHNLHFEYPGTVALQNVTCTIPKGSITGLAGPNGAGKTTLMRSISALASPLKGTICIEGVDTRANPRQIHAMCSYLSDFFGLYDNLTVTQCLQYALSIHDSIDEPSQHAVQRVIKELNLQPHANKKAGTLSRGLRQRLAIAQTIIHKPQYVLLDEPASGLDPGARLELAELLKRCQREGMTILVSSHILAELEDYCTHFMIIQDGQLKCFEEVNASQPSLQEKYQASTQGGQHES